MPQYRLIPVNDCIVDERYQREKIEPHIERIVTEFDRALFNVVEASDRGGVYAIFDGQQRLEAIKRRIKRGEMPKDYKLPAIVHSGLSPEQEAELFEELQRRRRSITPIERFRARAFYGDPNATAIKTMVEERGYRIESKAKPNTIVAPVILERIYHRGNLAETLDVMEIWRGEAGQFDRPMLDGVSRFLDLYPEADRNHAKNKWMNFGPKVIERRGVDLMMTTTRNKGDSLGILIVLREEYQEKIHRLPTIENAFEARRATEKKGRRRMVRFTDEQARDAAIDLERFQIQDFQEALGGVSRSGAKAALTTLHRRGIIRWRMADPKRDEGPGRVYEYIPISDRPKTQPKQPPPADPETTNGSTSTRRRKQQVKGTGKKRKITNAEIQQLIREAEAGGAKSKVTGSGHIEISGDGKQRVILPSTPSDSRSVANARAQLRRAGYVK